MIYILYRIHHSFRNIFSAFSQTSNYFSPNHQKEVSSLQEDLLTSAEILVNEKDCKQIQKTHPN
jgi:hypothetical protein